MTYRLLVACCLALVGLAAVGCEDNEGRGELLAGPSTDVHCAAERKLAAIPTGGVGDTTVVVKCPGSEP